MMANEPMSDDHIDRSVEKTTQDSIDRALARALCDSVERTTPGFSWRGSLVLVVLLALLYVVLILAAFGFILTK